MLHNYLPLREKAKIFKQVCSHRIIIKATFWKTDTFMQLQTNDTAQLVTLFWAAKDHYNYFLLQVSFIITTLIFIFISPRSQAQIEPSSSHRTSGLFSMQHLSGSITGISAQSEKTTLLHSSPMLSSTGTPSLQTALLMVLNNPTSPLRHGLTGSGGFNYLNDNVYYMIIITIALWQGIDTPVKLYRGSGSYSSIDITAQLYLSVSLSNHHISWLYISLCFYSWQNN